MAIGPDPRQQPPLSTRTIAATDRAAAGRVWSTIEQELPAVAVACSWVWTETWLAHYGDVVPHRFVVGVADGRDVAIALLTESPQRLPRLIGARQAHLGTAGEPPGEGVFVERNRLLVADARRDGFAAALIEHVHRDRRWDRLVLPGLHPVDAEAFQRACPKLVLDTQESPLAELALAVGGDPLELLAAGPRRRVRRALKGLGPLTTEWAQTRTEGHDIMDELVELHQRRWTAEDESGAFASARFSAFHRALIDRLEPGRGVVLVRVRSAGETLGCVYGQVEGGDVLFYQSGLRRLEDNKLNVGLAVHACAMRACAEHGMGTYDFLAPATRYKRDLSTRSGTLMWGSLERSRPRLHVYRTLRRLRAGARRAKLSAYPGQHS